VARDARRMINSRCPWPGLHAARCYGSPAAGPLSLPGRPAGPGSARSIFCVRRWRRRVTRSDRLDELSGRILFPRSRRASRTRVQDRRDDGGGATLRLRRRRGDSFMTATSTSEAARGLAPI